MKTKGILALIILSFYILGITGLSSAVVIKSVEIGDFYPGQSANLRVEVENTLNEDIENVILRLDLTETFFTTVGSSEDDAGDIDEDDEDTFTFEIKASSDIVPGDYNIPYTIEYDDADGDSQDKSGSFGITVSAKTEIDFVVESRGKSQDTAIVGQQGELRLEIINEGLGDLKSISVQVFPSGYELISKEKIFIGTIDSEDSDIATFEVIFNSQDPVLSARVTFKDFGNNIETKTINIPARVYTMQEALELGLVTKDSRSIYLILVVLVIVAWIIYRQIKKKNKRRK